MLFPCPFEFGHSNFCLFNFNSNHVPYLIIYVNIIYLNLSTKSCTISLLSILLRKQGLINITIVYSSSVFYWYGLEKLSQEYSYFFVNFQLIYLFSRDLFIIGFSFSSEIELYKSLAVIVKTHENQKIMIHCYHKRCWQTSTALN